MRTFQHVPPLRLPLFALLGALLCAGCGEGGARTTRTPDPIAVEIQRPLPLAQGGAIGWSGTIEAAESIPLSFSSIGTVARVLVSEGDVVRRGQLLAVLDTTSLRSMLDMALATERQAEDAHRRLEPMFRNSTLPEIKLIEAESNLARARASVALARKNLADAALRAPVSGVVGRRAMDPGMSAMPNATSITIVRIETVHARIAVSEREIPSLRTGMTARVRIAALGDDVHEGSIREIGVVADPVAHAYPVKVSLRNAGGRIKPGMICEVQLPTAASAQGVVIPVDAMLVDETGRTYVFVAANDKAQRRDVVQTGFAAQGIAIGEGLAPDDLVVVAGRHKLTDQAPIRIVNK